MRKTLAILRRTGQSSQFHGSYYIFRNDGLTSLCPDGWEGFHCKFKTGKVPECTLACESDGMCVIKVLNPAEADKLHHICDANRINDHMRCFCPPEFSGLLCQATTEERPVLQWRNLCDAQNYQ
jgi:hypothetical protein